MSNKKNKEPGMSKAAKSLGRDTVEEMDKLHPAELKAVIVAANSAMKQAKEELEVLPGYQKAKEDLKALSQGKREVDKRQKAKIQYALERLEGDA